MTEDEFDQLIDEATHAVNNLIPDGVLDLISEEQRSKLLVQINDALSLILRELVT